jgi:hypothetical protein
MYPDWPVRAQRPRQVLELLRQADWLRAQAQQQVRLPRVQEGPELQELQEQVPPPEALVQAWRHLPTVPELPTLRSQPSKLCRPSHALSCP